MDCVKVRSFVLVCDAFGFRKTLVEIRAVIIQSEDVNVLTEELQFMLKTANSDSTGRTFTKTIRVPSSSQLFLGDKKVIESLYLSDLFHFIPVWTKVDM